MFGQVCLKRDEDYMLILNLYSFSVYFYFLRPLFITESFPLAIALILPLLYMTCLFQVAEVLCTLLFLLKPTTLSSRCLFVAFF